MNSKAIAVYYYFLCLALLIPGMVLAHNGGMAYAYPVHNITIDASLADWPENAVRYPIHYNPQGYLPLDSDDFRGFFRVGYDVADQVLYVAVEVWDDKYIRSEENPEYWAHDLQVLYIDPRHNPGPGGVLGLEANEYVRKIVGKEENWDPIVRNYSWDKVELKVRRDGQSTIYEWKVKLDGYIRAGKVIGFDYIVFDKDDPEQEFQTAGWGPDSGIKHQCSPCLGDMLLLEDDATLTEVSGTISVKDSIFFPFPLRFGSFSEEAFYMDTHVDSAGHYKARLPEGRYRISAKNDLKWRDNEVFRVIYEGKPTITLAAGKPLTIDEPVKPSKTAPPGLIPEKGILPGFDASKHRDVDQFINTYMDYYGIPGVSLALIKDGRLVYHNTYGVSNLALGNALTPESLFEAASITKPVFAYVVLRLAERNEIDLEKPLHEYLVFDELEGKFPEYRKMTARHVLTHKSGLPNWGRELLHTPGTEYGYSGEGFEYLKRVVAKITGRHIEDVVNEELKQPLSLTHMEFSDSPYLRRVATTGHINSIPTVQSLPGEAGMAWSMHTEARAFTDFILALQERRGLKAETYADMMTIHSEFPEDETGNMAGRAGMGLGIGLGENKWGKSFFHGGNNGDFKCQFTMYEDLKMGFAVFTNNNTGDLLAEALAQDHVEGKKEDE
jgi:CubicO group peptidase (beta-lactamase class C family)